MIVTGVKSFFGLYATPKPHSRLHRWPLLSITYMAIILFVTTRCECSILCYGNHVSEQKRVQNYKIRAKIAIIIFMVKRQTPGFVKINTD